MIGRSVDTLREPREHHALLATPEEGIGDSMEDETVIPDAKTLLTRQSAATKATRPLSV